jgi:hypothetical protein
MFQRCLFLLTLAVALALAALVVLAPALVRNHPREQPAWLMLFGRDAVVRKAAIACALGLVATATLFFRTPRRARQRNRDRRTRPVETIGA